MNQDCAASSKSLKLPKYELSQLESNSKFNNTNDHLIKKYNQKSYCVSIGLLPGDVLWQYCKFGGVSRSSKKVVNAESESIDHEQWSIDSSEKSSDVSFQSTDVGVVESNLSPLIKSPVVSANNNHKDFINLLNSDKSIEILEIKDDSSVDVPSDVESNELNSLDKALLASIQILRNEDQEVFIKENLGH